MDRRALLRGGFLLLAIGLLLNPFYLSPGTVDGTASAVTYDVDEVESEAVARQVLYSSAAVLECGVERACALERQIREQGRLEVDGDVREIGEVRYDRYGRDGPRYEVVAFGEEFYVPRANHSGNATVLTHERVSPTEALERVAVPSDETSPAVREAVETGSVRLVEQRIPEFERGYPIAHQGDVYHVDGATYEGSVGTELLMTRLLLITVGVAILSVLY